MVIKHLIFFNLKLVKPPPPPHSSKMTIFGPFTTLVSSLLIVFSNSGSPLFPSYTEDLKINLNYTQSSINKISWFKDIGTNCDLIAFVIAEIFGPKKTILAASVTRFTALLLLYLAIKGRIRLYTWMTCVVSLSSAACETIIISSVKLPNIRLFSNRVPLVLLLISLHLNLGAAFLLALHLSTGENHRGSLILLIAVFPLLVTLCLLAFVSDRILVTSSSQKLRPFFYKVLGCSSFTSLFLFLTYAVGKLNPSRVFVSLASIMCLLPLILAYRIQSSETSQEPSEAELEEHRPQQSAEQETEETQQSEKPFQWSTAWSSDFLLLVLITSCSLGPTSTCLDLTAQVLESLALKSVNSIYLVLLTTLVTFFGKFFVSFLSDFLVQNFKIFRSFLFLPLLFLSAVSFVSLAFPIKHSFSIYFSYILVSFTHGGQLRLASMILQDVYKKEHHFLFCLLKIGVILINYILKIHLVSYFYSKEVKKSNPPLQNPIFTKNSCLGRMCFKDTFIIFSLFCFLAGFIWSFYCYRERRFRDRDYSRLIDNEGL